MILRLMGVSTSDVCPICGEKGTKKGFRKKPSGDKVQRYRCKGCDRRYSLTTSTRVISRFVIPRGCDGPDDPFPFRDEYPSFDKPFIFYHYSEMDEFLASIDDAHTIATLEQFRQRFISNMGNTEVYVEVEA